MLRLMLTQKLSGYGPQGRAFHNRKSATPKHAAHVHTIFHARNRVTLETLHAIDSCGCDGVSNSTLHLQGAKHRSLSARRNIRPPYLPSTITMIAGSLVLLRLPLEALAEAVSITRACFKQSLMLLPMLPLPTDTVLHSTQALQRFRFSVLAGTREPAWNSTPGPTPQCGHYEQISLATAIPFKVIDGRCHGYMVQTRCT
jgi:hypothetical protein